MSEFYTCYGSVIDLAKGYSMNATVTGRMSSKEPNLSNYPKTADGSSSFIFCQHAPPREAMGSLGLVWSYSLKAEYRRHQAFFDKLYPQSIWQYGRDVPPGVYTCVLSKETDPVELAFLPAWAGTQYDLGVDLPGRARRARCRLCGGWIVHRSIPPKSQWPRPAHLFSSTQLQTPLEKSFDKAKAADTIVSIEKRIIPDFAVQKKEVVIDSMAIMQDPGRGTNKTCESKFEHVCGALVWGVGFYNNDGRLSPKRYRFCSVAIEMHRKRGNKIEVFRDEDEEKPAPRQEAFKKTFGELYQERWGGVPPGGEPKAEWQKISERLNNALHLPPNQITLFQEERGGLSFAIDRDYINGGGLRFQAWRHRPDGYEIVLKQAISEAQLLTPSSPQADILHQYSIFVDEALEQMSIIKPIEIRTLLEKGR